MREGFKPYHVPQQSRRDKLRVVAQNHLDLQGCTRFVPLYNPSLLSSDLLACTNNSLSGVNEACRANGVCVVKEEAVSLMGFVGGVINVVSSTSSSMTHHPYFGPQSLLIINPPSIQDINANHFLFTPHNLQNLRDFHQPYNGGCEAATFKPESMPLVHESRWDSIGFNTIKEIDK